MGFGGYAYSSKQRRVTDSALACLRSISLSSWSNTLPSMGLTHAKWYPFPGQCPVTVWVTHRPGTVPAA